MNKTRIGQQVGPYRLARLLGAGGFGEVYEAEHRLLQQKRAIKLLLERHFHDPHQRERFLREARTLATLEHPNILPVLEVGEEGSMLYLVMPFYHRGTLNDLLKQRTPPLPLTEIERFLAQICAAVSYAHARHIAHLDLKPDNMLLHEDGRLVLSDFGLAHLIKQGRLEAGSSASWGTPYYMAPEQIRGEPELHSDLYALGVVLYQLLTTQHPFTGTTPEAVMMKHLLETPPKLRAVSPETLATLEPVVQKALEKKPEDRYATAEALLADFHAAMNRSVFPLEQVAGPPVDLDTQSFYPLQPGQILNEKLKIIQVLDAGYCKFTYKAEQMGTNPPHYYTIKELATGPTTSKENYKAVIEQFEKDVDLLRGLKHPSIASTILSFRKHSKYYLVVEFVPGHYVGRVLEENNRPLSEEKVVRWMTQICEALSYIHSYMLPIRTGGHLEPWNIMITPDNEARLLIDDICLEWYLLRYSDHRDSELKRHGHGIRLRDICYDSPEYLGVGGGRVKPHWERTDVRSDIYSLGAIMYHLLTNTEPAPVQTPLPESMLVKNPLLRTAQLDGKTVCLIEQVVIKAMQQNPLDRFQDAQAMRTALLDTLSHGG